MVEEPGAMATPFVGMSSFRRGELVEAHLGNGQAGMFYKGIAGRWGEEADPAVKGTLCSAPMEAQAAA